MRKIILASSSVWRRQIMESLGFPFEVRISGLDEEPFKKKAASPEELVLKLAKLKAKKVAEMLKKEDKLKKYLIIAADSVAYLKVEGKRKWQLFDKPKNLNQARWMLKKLKGKKHYFITALYLLDEKGKEKMAFGRSQIIFKNFSNQELEDFLKKNEWQGKAGGYDISHRQLVAAYRGSFSNVCGLPRGKLISLLKSFKFKWKKKR